MATIAVILYNFSEKGQGLIIFFRFCKREGFNGVLHVLSQERIRITHYLLGTADVAPIPQVRSDIDQEIDDVTDEFNIIVAYLPIVDEELRNL